MSEDAIKWNKREFMPLTINLSDTFLNNIPFKIVKDHFTYLGLKIVLNKFFIHD